MSGHSVISPSSFERAIKCPLSAILPRTPSIESAFALEGTEAHEVFEQVMRAVDLSKNNYLDVIKLYAKGDHYKPIVDSVMYIKKVITNITNVDIFTEKRVDLGFIIPDMFGTMDLAIHDKQTNTLHIFDFKYGIGIPVSAKKNKQLLLYAIGFVAWREQDYSGVIIHIIQPRIDNFDSYRVEIGDITEIRNEAKDLINDILLRKTASTTGKHCRFCPAMLSCPIVRKVTRDIINAGDEVGKLDKDDLGYIYAHKLLVEKFFIQASETLMASLERGEDLKYVKLTERAVARKWVSNAVERFMEMPNPQKYLRTAPKPIGELKKVMDIEFLDGLLEPATKIKVIKPRINPYAGINP